MFRWLACACMLLLGAAHVRAQADGLPPPVPGDVEKRGRRFVFRWEPVTGAQGYHLQVGRSLLFSPRVADMRSRSPRPTAEVRGLPQGQFYWRVSSVDAQGNEGAFSPAQPLVLSAPRRTSVLIPLVEVSSDGTEPDDADEPPRTAPPPARTTRPTTPTPANPPPAPTPPPAPAPSPRAPRRGRLAADTACSCPSPEGPASVDFQWEQGRRRRLQVARDGTFRRPVVDRVVPGTALTLSLKPGTYFHRWAPVGTRKWSSRGGLLIRCDERAPAIQLDSPPARLFTTAAALVVEGSTEPGAALLLNDHAMDTGEQGAFGVNVALQPGLNIIHLVATDAMGNETHRTVHATMYAEPFRQDALARLALLQRRLNALDARRSDVERSAQAVLQDSPREHRPALLELVRTLEPELRAQRATKRDLAGELAVMTLELQPTPGVKVPAPGAVVTPLPAPRPDAPPPLPPRD